MKKILVTIALVAFTLGAIAQDSTKTKRPVSDAARYCAIMQDGQMIVTKDGSRITSDITLSNGMKITVKALLIQKDGRTRSMNVGECVDDISSGRKL